MKSLKGLTSHLLGLLSSPLVSTLIVSSVVIPSLVVSLLLLSSLLATPTLATQQDVAAIAFNGSNMAMGDRFQ